jgi:hypothetical protein
LAKPADSPFCSIFLPAAFANTSTLGASWNAFNSMKRYFFVALVLFAAFQKGHGQNVNLIIQVNEELVYGDISNLYLKIEGDTVAEKL